MELSDFSDSLRAFTKGLETQLPLFMSQLALDAKDMIEQRVTTTGLNSKGNEFGQYAEGTYKEFREEKGLNTSFVDFRNTGAMWKSINVVGTKISATLATATLGSQTQEEEDKLEWQEERYGDEVLELTTSEIVELEITYNKLIENLLKSFVP